MRKVLVILGVVALVFAANLSANTPALTRPDGAGKAAGRQGMVPPILSQAGPKATNMARTEMPAPTKITPVVKGPGEKFAPTPEDWATYMHDSCHTCMIDGNAGGLPTAAWTYVTPGGGQTAFSGSPVESDGIVCFTSSDGYLYAINRTTGATAWAPVLEGAANYRGGTPVIWQDRVVSAMVTGTGTTSSVFCNSMADGSSLWTTPIPPTPNVWNIYLSRPIVLSVSGTAYVFYGCGDFTATATRVIGLNMSTGALAYDTTIASNVIIGGLATDGQVLFVPLQTTGVVALQPATAPHFNYLWTQNPAPTAVVNSTPVYYDGQVYCAQGAITGPEMLYAMDVSDGSINWSRTVGDGTMGLDLGSPAIGGDMVYMYASNFSTSPYSTQIMAYHQSDGTDAWSTWYTTTDGLFDGGLAVTTGTNKRVYLATGFGSTALGHLITLDAGSGSLVQDLPYATDYLYNSICRPYGGLYTLTYGSSAAGTLVAWNVNDGQPAGADVGATTVLAPGAMVNPGASIAPQVRIMNYGTTAQSNIPVYCHIDSSGTTIYDHNVTYPGPLAPGATADVTISTNWAVGTGNFTYDVKAFTALSNDSVRMNDTVRSTTMVFNVIDTLVALTALSTPTIDGVINPGEWTDANQYDVSDVLGQEGSPAPAGSAIFWSKHDASYVYYAVDLPTATARVDYDQVGCYLDENNDQAWAGDQSEGNHWFAFLGGVDTTLYRSLPDYTIRWGGVPPNGIQASSLTSGHLQFEARVNKGTNNWDYNINPGEDTVGFYMYAANGGGANYLGHWPTTMPGASWNDPTQYGTLILSQNVSAVSEDALRSVPAVKLTVSPNPAAGFTGIHYSVNRPGMVSLKLYDITGKLVSNLVNTSVKAGSYQRVIDASQLARGIYLVRLATDNSIATSKLIIE